MTDVRLVLRKSKLRQLMKAVDKKSEDIPSPLAKYDSNGSLNCIICQQLIKPSTLEAWNRHSSNNSHKQKLVALAQAQKQKEQSAQLSDSKSSKRVAESDDLNMPPPKRAKTEEINFDETQAISSVIPLTDNMESSQNQSNEVLQSNGDHTITQSELETLRREWDLQEESVRSFETRVNQDATNDEEENEEFDMESEDSDAEDDSSPLNSTTLMMSSTKTPSLDSLLKNRRDQDFSSKTKMDQDDGEDENESSSESEDTNLDDLYDWRSRGV